MARLSSVASLFLTLVAGFLWFLKADERNEPTTVARVPWHSGKVLGSPEAPPAYRLINPFPKLKFTNPLQFVSLRGTDRLFVVEQNGKIFSFRNQVETKAELFFDPAAELTAWQQTPQATAFESSYALVFHPKFAENRTCFVCYTVKGKNVKNLENGSRISRFLVNTEQEPWRIDPTSEELLLTFKQGGHNGCDMHFGPDGYLYICTGDAADPNPPDVFRTGQDISDLEASVLRIDVDRRDPGKNYAIPKDNPFIGTISRGKPARPEVWSYGYRNAWRMSFDRVTGQLWVGDVGWELWELVHKVTRGHNGGWSIFEGPQDVNLDEPQGPTPVTRPAIEVPHTEGASMTGGYVYRGKKFPELVGHYVFGDWVTKRIWAADVTSGEPGPKRELTRPTARVVAFGEDDDGELFVVDYDEGTILTLAPNEQALYDPAAFPRKLSETGLFSNTATHEVAPGVSEFVVNSKQWEDFATARYFIAIPGIGKVIDYREKKQIPNNVSWHKARLHFPQHTVLVKTISLELERGNPASAKRIETQLMHFDGEMWAGYTYAWNDDETDAELVPAEGAERLLTVKDSLFHNGIRKQNWTYYGRSQCVQCHHSWAEYTLAFNIEQLNRRTERNGSTENQLVALINEGYLERRNRDEQVKPCYTDAELSKEPKLANPYDPSEHLEARAKAYFHVNCGHCHRFGGGGGVDFELHAFCDLKSNKLINANPQRGTLNLEDAKIIAPGAPQCSTVLMRMAKFGNGRMPHIGSEFVDVNGVALIAAWIDSLGRATSEAPTNAASSLWKTKLALALALGSEASELNRKELIAELQKLPPGTERDLYSGYFPQMNLGNKLGSNPKPRSILALSGDPEQGKSIFFQERTQCAKCHQVSGQGVSIGPELTTIGKIRNKELLLESILEPSRRIDLEYTTYTIVLVDGRSFSGLQTKKSEHQIVLKLADGKLVTIATEEIESIVPSRESLMPAGLLADLTAQEAADLLSYLLSLRGD